MEIERPKDKGEMVEYLRAISREWTAADLRDMLLDLAEETSRDSLAESLRRQLDADFPLEGE